MMDAFSPVPQETQRVHIQDEQMALKLLEQAKYNINSNFLKIAEYLYTISERQLYAEWGYESLWEFLEKNENLDFERRTAEMLLRIWKSFGPESHLPIPLKTLAEIGYLKTYYLTMIRKAGILTKSNLNEWIEKAKLMSSRKFKKEIDKALGKEVKEDEQWITFTFRVPPQETESINQAIYEVARIEGIPEEEITKRRGELLARIIEDWRGYYSSILYDEELSNEEIRKKRLEKIKEQIEATFGITVVFVENPEEV